MSLHEHLHTAWTEGPPAPVSAAPHKTEGKRRSVVIPGRLQLRTNDALRPCRVYHSSKHTCCASPCHCGSTNTGSHTSSCETFGGSQREEVWIMTSSPSPGRKKIHFPAFPGGLCGDCGREARQAVDGPSAGHAAELTDFCDWLFQRNHR